LLQYRSVFVAFLVLISGALCAQAPDSVKIIGEVKADSGSALMTEYTKVYLNPFDPDDDYFMADVDAKGNFTLSVPIKAPTLYIMKYRDYKMEVLLTPAEPVFKVAIKANNREIKNMKVVDSHEYEAYRRFKKINNAFKEKLPEVLAEYKKEPKVNAEKVKKEMNDVNGLLEFLRHTYPGTYAAAYLAPMAEMPDLNTGEPIMPQLQKHFFDKAAIADSMLYRTFEFTNQVSVYIENIADTNAAERIKFISSMAEKAKENLGTQKLLLLMLLNNFANAKREDYLASLAAWAASLPNFADGQPVMAAKLKLIAKIIPGALAPEVVGEDTSGHEQSLLAFAKKNKATLLLFWSSDCPHCKAEMPNVVDLYNKYHNRGLDIFGASTEQNKDKWKRYVSTNKLPWLQTIISGESPAHADYFIQYTPTFVLINSSGAILHRFISIGDLDGMIGQVLAK
jgi:thiol-disulfide isomerase/thioredoxin